MNKKVIVFGAGGHGRVIADIICASGDELVGFLDDDSSISTLGRVDDYICFPDACFVIGIGNAKVREKISHYNCKWYTAIHPSAVISPSATIGEGSVVMPNAVVNSGAIIGTHCIINSGAIVEHDNVIEDYAHVSVGAKLGGTTHIGKRTWVGIGATVIQGIRICDDCVVGAGAVVVKNIDECGTYLGIPATKHNK